MGGKKIIKKSGLITLPVREGKIFLTKKILGGGKGIIIKTPNNLKNKYLIKKSIFKKYKFKISKFSLINVNSPSQNFLAENFTLPHGEGDETANFATGIFTLPHKGRVMRPLILSEGKFCFIKQEGLHPCNSFFH
ncbi:MAG: hypothetical protein ACO26G_05140 [Rickettsiales bacterium]